MNNESNPVSVTKDRSYERQFQLRPFLQPFCESQSEIECQLRNLSAQGNLGTDPLVLKLLVITMIKLFITLANISIYANWNK